LNAEIAEHAEKFLVFLCGLRAPPDS